MRALVHDGRERMLERHDDEAARRGNVARL